MKIKFIFAWYDLWIGAFWDKQKYKLYLLPLPMIGVVLQFKKYKQCPEFSFYGAKYPDARCVDGRLFDLDKCDEFGNLYEPHEDVPCPFCNTEEFVKNHSSEYGSESDTYLYINNTYKKYKL